MTTVIGTPGAHTRTLMHASLARCALFAVLGALCAAPAVLLLVTASGAAARAASVCGTIAAAVCAWRYNDEKVAYLKARAGLRTEQRVARVVERCGAAFVLHGALLGERAGDADHVLLGPCVVVVESKSGRGRISYRDGVMHAGPRRLPRDPVRQVRVQRDLLAARAGCRVDAVVCVADSTSPARQYDGVWVCSLVDLPGVLASLPARVGDAAALASRLAAVPCAAHVGQPAR